MRWAVNACPKLRRCACWKLAARSLEGNPERDRRTRVPVRQQSGSVGPDDLRAEEGCWRHAEEAVTGWLAAFGWATDGPPSPCHLPHSCGNPRRRPFTPSAHVARRYLWAAHVAAGSGLRHLSRRPAPVEPTGLIFLPRGAGKRFSSAGQDHDYLYCIFCVCANPLPGPCRKGRERAAWRNRSRSCKNRLLARAMLFLRAADGAVGLLGVRHSRAAMRRPDQGVGKAPVARRSKALQDHRTPKA